MKLGLNNLTIFPNPVVDRQFKIVVNGESGPIEIFISDILGRRISSQKFESNIGIVIFPENPSAKGQYLIKVKTRISIFTRLISVK